VNGTWSLIRQIAQREDVAKILDNAPLQNAQPVESYTDNSASRSAIEWGIERINADDVWAWGFRGQGVVVGGEDTGYDWTHPALKTKYRGYIADLDTADHNYNWHDAIHMISPLNNDSLNPCGLDVKQPCDDQSHGTHTMGTMIGSDGDNEIGVAPEAKWCGCRNMERGWGSPFTYLECFQWFLAPTDLNNENPDPLRSPHVINNSWGCPPVEGCDTSNFELLNTAVNNLRAAGVVVVVSAGNEGPLCSTVQTPAAIYEGSFSVGATAPNDTIAGFSSRGPVAVDSSFRLKPNVSAPGVGVRSARPGGNYGYSSGTSMAGPHVAGLVALVISANPELAGKVEVIETIIEQTAVPKTTDQQCGEIPGTDIPNNTYGYGRVDALAAVNAALALIGVGTHDEQDATIALVFPNPTEGKFFIENAMSPARVSVDVFNIDGKWITHQQSAQPILTVDMANEPSGLYFYKITGEGKTFLGKVVKK
jgi:subtilisin family serine protease